MTFHPKGLFALVGFAAVVWLGVSARSGELDPRWAIAGVIAYVVVDVVVTLGFSGRPRSR